MIYAIASGTTTTALIVSVQTLSGQNYHPLGGPLYVTDTFYQAMVLE